MFNCKICKRKFESSKGLAKHFTRTHNISPKYYYDTYLSESNVHRCEVCGETTNFISTTRGYAECCSRRCATMDPWNKGKHLSECIRQKISKSCKGRDVWNTGKHTGGLTTEHKIKLSKNKTVNGFAGYAYHDKISFAEEFRKDPDNNLIINVRCSNCGDWFKPTRGEMRRRIQALYGQVSGENRFYCSENCKTTCQIFGQVLYRKDENRDFNKRTHQKEFSKFVKERDEDICQICGADNNLIAHHIEPVVCNPLESLDIDNGITLCCACHGKVHTLPWCTYTYLSKYKEFNY